MRNELATAQQPITYNQPPIGDNLPGFRAGDEIGVRNLSVGRQGGAPVRGHVQSQSRGRNESCLIQPIKKPVALDPKTPLFQPASYDATTGPKFASSEILWWNNGVWGTCGYAIPNDGGKPTTSNETIWRVHQFVGFEVFNLMHRPDVKFSRPFNADWLFDFNKMLTLGIKRMNDLAVHWTTPRDGDAQHVMNTPKAFLYYPVPYFGNRIRQQDALTWCGKTLKLLGEIQQHSDNDYDDNVTDFFCSMVQQTLVAMQKDLGMKYLGYKREEVECARFYDSRCEVRRRRLRPIRTVYLERDGRGADARAVVADDQ